MVTKVGTVEKLGGFDPDVERAPWGGQSGELELTVEPGFRKKEAHV